MGVAEAPYLDRAAVCEGAGVEEQDDVPPPLLREREPLAGAEGNREVRGLGA